MSLLLRNECRPEENGMDMPTPVHPMAPPLPRSPSFFGPQLTTGYHFLNFLMRGVGKGNFFEIEDSCFRKDKAIRLRKNNILTS